MAIAGDEGWGKVNLVLRELILDLADAFNVGDRYGLAEGLARLALLPNNVRQPTRFPLYSLAVSGLIVSGVEEWAGDLPFDADMVTPIAQAARERLTVWWVGDNPLPSLEVFVSLLCPETGFCVQRLVPTYCI